MIIFNTCQHNKTVEVITIVANKRQESIEEKVEHLRRLVEFGERLKEEREKMGLSIRELAKEVGVSANYLSELERGMKSPSDKMVRDLADYFKVDETVGFAILGRVPLLAKEELEGNETIQHTLADIGKKKNVSDEQKQILYDRIYALYRDFIDEIEGD